MVSQRMTRRCREKPPSVRSAVRVVKETQRDENTVGKNWAFPTIGGKDCIVFPFSASLNKGHIVGI